MTSNARRWRTDGVRIIRSSELDDATAQTLGMHRRAAVTTEKAGAKKLWAGTVTIEANAKTGAHHHGDLESVIYVVSGLARLRWGDQLEFVAEATPGDFIYVPPYVPHQEINASEDVQLHCVLARSGQQGLVIIWTSLPWKCPSSSAGSTICTSDPAMRHFAMTRAARAAHRRPRTRCPAQPRKHTMSEATYQLYGRPNAGSLAVQIVLEEIGEPYELLWVERTPEALEAYRRINPAGKVPALVLPDGTPVCESAAILTYLASAYPAAHLAPDAGSAAHARFLQWMVFLSANVYETALRYYYAERYSTAGAAAQAGIQERALQDYLRHLEAVHEALAPYVLGRPFRRWIPIFTC